MEHNAQTENYSLRQQMEVLLHEARLNEEKMRRFDKLERQLIGANSLAELIRVLLAEYKLAFGVEFVTLTLIDREYEVTRILERESDGGMNTLGLSLLQTPAALDALYPGAYHPRLEPFEAARHAALFNTPTEAIASVALLPLIRHGQVIGSFHFGSTDTERYVSGCGTHFLERLAAIIAVCLDSALTQERLKQAGLTDGLTGVHNRRYFDHRYQIEVSQARRHKHPLACLLLDVDRFKRVNDTYGHQTGDEVLRVVAGVIQAQLRTGDTVARYGGEEFVVLLPQTEAQHALEIAERIRCSIAEQRLRAPSGEEIGVTISIGLSVLSTEALAGNRGQADESLIPTADKALYRAKHSGRNRVVCAETSQPNPSSTPPKENWQMLAVSWCSRLLYVAQRAVVAAMKGWSRA